MPVRYALAVALTAGLVGITFLGMSHLATSQTQQQMDEQIADIESTATTLLEEEDVPPEGQSGAQRQLTIELPDDSWTSDPVEVFRIEPADGNGSFAEYVLEDGTTYQRHIEARIVGDDGGGVEFSGTGSTHELLLILEADEDGQPLVRIVRR